MLLYIADKTTHWGVKKLELYTSILIPRHLAQTKRGICYAYLRLRGDAAAALIDFGPSFSLLQTVQHTYSKVNIPYSKHTITDRTVRSGVRVQGALEPGLEMNDFGPSFSLLYITEKRNPQGQCDIHFEYTRVSTSFVIYRYILRGDAAADLIDFRPSLASLHKTERRA